jgi:GntR family transcriptional regulator, vanillate catabolism transcriptional regulator
MSATRVSKIVYDLSQLIIQGELGPDEIVGEVQLAEKFGVSRTPIRQALAILNEEGLVQKSSGRSYKVRRFAHQEILDAIEVRCVLEGLAVRSVAEHKSGARVVRELDACLSQGSDIVQDMETKGLSPKAIDRYYTLNSRFHAIILQGAQNDALRGALEIANRVPFVSVGSLARYKNFGDERSARREIRYFVHSHMQHCEMVEAIRAGQGARAEAVMRSHAQISVRNITIQLPPMPGDLDQD